MSQTSEHGGSEDDQVLVAEFALDLLEGGERAAVARRIAAEPALAADLKLWRTRLATLDNEFAETAPPANVLPRVEARLFGTTAAPGGWWNSLPLWRGLAGAAAAVAIVAIGFNMMQPRFDKRSGKQPMRLIEQPRFRAGYDFLLLRAESGEVPMELADWWTHFHTADYAEREEMLLPDTDAKKKRRRRRSKKPGSGEGGDSSGDAA